MGMTAINTHSWPKALAVTPLTGHTVDCKCPHLSPCGQSWPQLSRLWLRPRKASRAAEPWCWCQGHLGVLSALLGASSPAAPLPQPCYGTSQRRQRSRTKQLLQPPGPLQNQSCSSLHSSLTCCTVSNMPLPRRNIASDTHAALTPSCS